MSVCTARTRGESSPRPTPDHFPLADLDQAALDRVLDRYAPDSVIDVVPLSPLQAGMLFESAHRPGDNQYVTQAVYAVSAAVDPDTLAAAWRHVTDRHEVLRTTFVTDGVPHPVQVVHRGFPAPIRFLDWTGRDVEAGVDRLLARRRAEGFDLACAPPTAFDLVRLGPSEHRLVWHQHHVLLDAWSGAVVLDELSVAYRALADTGRLPELPEPVPFRRHVAWLHGRSAEDEAHDLDLWSGLVGGLDAATRLPFVAARPGGGGPGSVKRVLPRSLAERADAAARGWRCTTHTLVQAAWALTLAKLSGMAEVCWGTVLSGRSSDEDDAERVVGLMINTVPARVPVPAAAEVGEWLADVHSRLGAMRRAEHVGLDRIRALTAVRGGAPLFETLFQFVDRHQSAAATAKRALPLTLVRAQERTGLPVDLTVVADRGLRAHLVFERTTVSDADAEALMDEFSAMIERLCARGTGATVADLLAVDEREAATLARWATSGEYTGPTDLAALFAAVVAERPDARAVAAHDRTLTYRELDHESDRWALALARLGVGVDDIVAVSVPRSADLIAALVGVLKVGAAYLSLDADVPAERTRFIVADCRPAALLATAATAALVPLPTVLAERLPHPEPIRRVAHPEALAFVTYTSGSTGTPKCVGMSRRNLARLSARPDYLEHGAAHTYAHIAPLAFDASLEEVWTALLTGAALVVPAPGRLDVPDVAALVRDRAVTSMTLTTGLFHQVAEQDPTALAGLRQLVIGGEAALTGACAKALAANPGLRLVNSYGPTENTCVTTATTLPPDAAGPVPIGVPITGTSVRVLDADLRPVPIGAVGQLCAGGAGVSRGYLTDPALTAARFVPDPFSAVPGARMYLTGDLARWRPDGVLEFRGRVDRQVKIRGFRVEPGEIEARLSGHPDIGDAAVVAHPVDGGHHRLVGYVVIRDGSGLTGGDARAFLRRSLPEHMVPSTVVVLDAFPLTSNGKVDRDALPEPTWDGSADRRAPSTPAEEAIAATWRRVLGVAEIGVDDNFFDLGGDSILSIRVSALAREAGYAVTSADVFDHQTVAALAAAVARRQNPRPAQQTPVVGEVPLTPIQHWFLTEMGPVDHFTQSKVLRWRDRADPAAVRTALTALVTHHDALRLRVRADGAGWRQTSAPADALDSAGLLRVVDMTGLDPQAAHQHAGAVQKGLSLTDGPLLLALLLRHDDHDDLLVAVHHMAVDVVSWSFLLADLARAYTQAVDGRAVTLPAKTTSYQDWAKHLAGHVSGPDFARDKAYWTQVRAEPRALPEDARAAGSGTGWARVRLDVATTARFRAGTRRGLGTAADELLLAALVPVLARWAGDGPLAVDVETHGRHAFDHDHDATRTVGWFTAVHPVVLDLTGAGSLGGYLAQIRDQVGAMPHRGLGYGVARYLAGRETGAAVDSGARVSFNYVGDGATAAPTETGWPFTEAPRTLGAEFDPATTGPYHLEIVAGIVDGALELTVLYAADRFTPTTGTVLAEDYGASVRRFTDQVSTWGARGVDPAEWLRRVHPATPLLPGPMTRYRVPGLAVATLTGGEAAAWGHGATSTDGEPVTDRTLFQVGSVVKHVSALAVSRMVREGALTLDTPVSDLLAAPPGVTVRHLLNHTSGLAGTADRLTAAAEPGAAYRYDSLNQTVLERVVAAVEGMDFAKALTRLVLEPLGMADSRLLPEFPDAAETAGLAAGHTATGRRYRGRGSGDEVLWSSARDMARLAGELHRSHVDGRGAVLTREDAVALGAGLRAGYGLATVVKTIGSRRWIGHPGDGPGFRSVYAVEPVSGHGLVVLANGDGATPLLEDLLAELGVDLVMRVQGPLMTWDRGETDDHR